MLFNKVFSPQYMLWVLVYAIIAGWSSLMVGLISAAGLADFSSSFIVLYLSKTNSHAYGWWIVPGLLPRAGLSPERPSPLLSSCRFGMCSSPKKRIYLSDAAASLSRTTAGLRLSAR